MTYNSIRNISFYASIIFHLLLLGLFLIWKVSITYPARDYVELSFGVSGEFGSSGAIGSRMEKVEEIAEPEEKSKTADKSSEVKEVELPKAVNTANENVIKPADKSKEVASKTSTESKETKTSQSTSTGKGNRAEGEGNFGLDIDWGGQGTRRIYSYSIPPYPEGVQKEINIRLRFTILPDGSVGTIRPITKADTRLENAAINSLRQWRFEPLSPSQPRVEQTAIIVFPFKLQ
jgi:outer membrane biosynthesis protein TonB